MTAYRLGDANLNGLEPEELAGRPAYGGRRPTGQYGTAAGDLCNPQQQQQHQFVFREFTRDSLAKIRKRKLSKAKRNSVANADGSKQAPEPDPFLASGIQLPQYVLRRVPAELIGKPIEDIDPYYADKETFVIISRGKELIRFSANKALWLFGPFHPIRRIVLYILVSSVFNLFVILTILVNCILMTIQGSESVERTIEDTEIIFTVIYTFEFLLKVTARGFLFGEFAYLHDPWNILDVTVITLSYLTIVIQDLGNLSVMRTFRVLRALKTVAIIPGMKTIVGAVIDSVKNLKDVVVLTLFSLSVFSLLGLQIYMGLLTQKCILNGPADMNDSQWHAWNSNSSHWLKDPESDTKSYKLCGNATGAQPCPAERTCLQGFGPNPDYGFTNFDTFGWSLICSFRLMTQDYWEGLYMQILKTAGSWHIIFFIVSIFLGSIYLMNLILAIVAMSYNELQRRAEEEEEANMEDEAAFLESCRLMELQERGSADCSGRGSQLGVSYRPSLEIGLVGQSLLASFCQNGLLDKSAREKLDRQVFSPSYPPGSGAGLRSRSLCVNMEPRPRRPSNQWMQYGLLVPCRPRAPQAASLNELSRRKSSVRTTCSIKTSSSSSSVVGQRRLMRDIPVSGHRAGERPRLRRQRLPSHHVSSNALMPAPDQHDSYAAARTRSSAISDKDLQLLQQKAAMIRINQTFGLQGLAGRSDQAFSVGAQGTPMQGRSSSVQISRVRRQRTGSSLSSAAPVYASADLSGRYKSEAAICEQPSSAHPLGRIVAKQNLANLSLGSFRTGRQSFTRRRRSSQKKPSQDSPRRRSALVGSAARSDSSFDDSPGSYRDKQQLSPTRSFKESFAHSRPSHRQSSSTDINAAGPTQLGHSGNKSCSLKTLRLSSNRLDVREFGDGGDSDGMRHLSVENFQHFNVNRPLQRLASGGGACSKHFADGNKAAAHGDQSPQQHTTTNLDAAGGRRRQSLVGAHLARGHRDKLEIGRLAGQARASMSRARHSILPVGYMAPTTEEQQYLQSQYRQSFAGPARPANIRRMSRDFVRHADGWSRLSMSGQVDLRRLLRLWSHSNPYQNRPSIGSCSLNSQASQVSRHYIAESPSHSHQLEADEAGGRAGAARRRGSQPEPSCGPRGARASSHAIQPYEVLSAISGRDHRYQSDARAHGTSIPLDDNLASDQMSVGLRDKCIAYCLSCLDIMCIWECCEGWVRVQRLIALVVFDPFTELFILLCILINTLFMALDNDDADAQMRRLFEQGNYFFTATFVVEAVMKIIALSPKFYFREGFNVFDAIIVGLSLLELTLEGVYGLSVLRTFRLLRVFRLARSWPTMNVLISICGHAISDVGNLTFVLAIIMFIFAVMGMQLFGNKYTSASFADGVVPRWNFKDFMHSFMMVFRILCAEWIEPLWDCMNAAPKEICIPFFITAVIIGNLVLLNLFLALLLASFGTSNLSGPQADHVDTRKLQQAIARFKRFGRFTKRVSLHLVARLASWLLCREDRHEGAADGPLAHRRSKRAKSHIVTMSRQERQQNIERRTEELKSKIRRSPDHHFHLKQLAKSQLEATQGAH